MSYKWKPNASQRAAFKERMQDPDEKQAYEEKKRFKHSYEGFKNKEFVPTQSQYYFVMNYSGERTSEQQDAFNQVIYGFGCKEKIHHDYIHIVNELIRSQK